MSVALFVCCLLENYVSGNKQKYVYYYVAATIMGIFSCLINDFPTNFIGLLASIRFYESVCAGPVLIASYYNNKGKLNIANIIF